MFSFIAALVSKIFSVFFLHGYVGGGGAFLPPLGSEEEREYINRCRMGDEEARAKLIEHNLRLVAHIAKKYSPTAANDADDLISIGTIGLIKAIDTFDENKNIRLATYASRCIANEILMVMRAAKNSTKEVSLQEPIGTDSEGNNISLLNVICADDDDFDDVVSMKMMIDKLRRAIEKRLDGREKKVIAMRYGLDGKKSSAQREIAKIMNISRSYVSRIETKAIKKLREEMAEDIDRYDI